MDTETDPEVTPEKIEQDEGEEGTGEVAAA